MKCQSCSGKGHTEIYDKDNRRTIRIPCGACNGSGKK